jgi:Kef-type K+ transport system membrane component KefB/nucleotide-binding universal stress UspA family protein
VVADQLAREADQDRSQGGPPRALRDLPDGRGRGVTTDVRRVPNADRPVAGTARATMKGLRGGKALITIGEVRLDGGKATSSSAPTQPILDFRSSRHPSWWMLVAPAQKARRWPSRSRESGECRFRTLGAARSRSRLVGRLPRRILHRAPGTRCKPRNAALFPGKSPRCGLTMGSYKALATMAEEPIGIFPAALLHLRRSVMVLALSAVGFLLITTPAFAADRGPQISSDARFLLQIVLLLVCARLLGEWMQRIGQPAVMGQLIAGMLLGPSVLGAIWPWAQQSLFPTNAEQQAMIGAVAELGILLLLLLTGMETDLSVVRQSRRATFCVAIAGMAVPFLAGVALGEKLPEALLPDPAKRLVTALFLGTALSVSSVKIVVMVVREVGFLRRTVGQVMVAAAIIDDTIGWIVISIAFGLSAHGAFDPAAIARSLGGVTIFLVLSFTVGRRLVFRAIRWANDNFVSDMPVITAIIVITGTMALITDAIGVNTVLGAFVAGILVGQSPILTRHIDEQLRGLIFALFMPIFFGLAGLTTNLAVLTKPGLLHLTIGLVAIASLGKFAGVYLGGRVGRLNSAEAVALGCGMNARGSTEIIVATMGLSIGALTQGLFTAIVAMAVVTTMSMPPMLRWALERLPLTPEEAARLEREELEERGYVSKIERLLIAVDASPSGQFASQLAGLLAGARRIATTVIHLDYATAESDRAEQAERTREVVNRGVATGDEAGPTEPRAGPVEITTRVENPTGEALATEAKKGYGLLVIGREPASEGDSFHEQITRTAVEFAGPFAIVIARGIHREDAIGAPLNILVPITGTTVSRQGAELAIVLAHAAQGSITALHAASGNRSPRSWGQQIGTALAPTGSAEAIIREVVRLGDPYGVEVRGAVRNDGTPLDAILRQLAVGGHNLLIMGVSPRTGDHLFFGPVAAELLDRAKCSVLFLASEPSNSTITTNDLVPVGGNGRVRRRDGCSLARINSLSLW